MTFEISSNALLVASASRPSFSLGPKILGLLRRERQACQGQRLARGNRWQASRCSQGLRDKAAKLQVGVRDGQRTALAVASWARMG